MKRRRGWQTMLRVLRNCAKRKGTRRKTLSIPKGYSGHCRTHSYISAPELNRVAQDWARQETYEAVINVAKEHGGGYGLGINYAKTMLGEHASEAGAVKK